ncbi:MAG: hypothetical protein IJY12_03975, partial [Clostridia bacterium]|nr:hypothetical protein [Clostridia bacterium]
LGDCLYGREDPAMPRQALHAWSLSIADGEERMHFFAPVPEDIRARVASNLPNLNLEELL